MNKSHLSLKPLAYAELQQVEPVYEPQWRYELVRTAAEAKVFLRRELEKLGITSKLVWDISEPIDGERGFHISADVKGRDNAAFYATGRIFEHVLIIDSFEVGGYRKQNLSLIGLKALIGIATQYTQGLHSIDLVGVQEDGPRYWAHLSAMPERGGDRLFENLAGLLKLVDVEQYSQLIGSQRYMQLVDAYGVAKEHPAIAFRKLSQIKRAANGPDVIDYICDTAIQDVCKDHPNRILVIDLMDMNSVAILNSKMGVLPIEPIPTYLSQHTAAPAPQRGANSNVRLVGTKYTSSDI